MPIYAHAILAFISCIGFAVLFNVKKEDILVSAVIGGLSWTLVVALDIPQVSYIFSNMLSACIVGLASELFAVIKKTPATTFVVIGVIPLVPGFRIYRSMLFFVTGKIENGIAEGIRASFIAVAIAVGIIVSTSLARLIKQQYTHYRHHQK